jgi:hypothetical protein
MFAGRDPGQSSGWMLESRRSHDAARGEEPPVERAELDALNAQIATAKEARCRAIDEVRATAVELERLASGDPGCAPQRPREPRPSAPASAPSADARGARSGAVSGPVGKRDSPARKQGPPARPREAPAGAHGSESADAPTQALPKPGT